MQTLTDKNREKARRDRAKKAVALAMRSNWDEAVMMNRAIVKHFPDDLEAHNRLGKALSELGRNREARIAFRKALEISPHNGIARKNLDRLMSIGDQDASPSKGSVEAAPKVFIEESGKATTTTLISLASSDALLKLTPGHRVNLEIESSRMNVTDAAGEYVGSVEPKLTARLLRLVRGGNQYEAAVTHASAQELTIIIRETYKHPSQAGIVSFPSRGWREIPRVCFGERAWLRRRRSGRGGAGWKNHQGLVRRRYGAWRRRSIRSRNSSHHQLQRR